MRRTSRHIASTAFAQFVVVCLLALIASPCTAPVATCDPSGAVLHIGLEDDGGESLASKIAVDTALAVVIATTGSPLTASIARVHGSAFTLATASQTSLFPLRL